MLQLTDNPGMLKYCKAITDEFNKWAAAYDKATKDGMNLIDEGIAAFMCNAISGSVYRSTTQELKDYFAVHAQHEAAR